VEELLHEIGNEKKRSKWKSCDMKQAMKRREEQCVSSLVIYTMFNLKYMEKKQ
jgi:hypothetical protein